MTIAGPAIVGKLLASIESDLCRSSPIVLQLVVGLGASTFNITVTNTSYSPFFDFFNQRVRHKLTH